MLTWYPSELPGSSIGTWVRQAHVTDPAGTQTTQASYTVNARPVTAQADRGQVQAGEAISYAITGPPNEQIRWTSWINGQPSGESNAFYNQHTDGNGVFIGTTTWTDTRGGTWTRQVTVGGQTAQFTLDVTAPPPPPPPTPPLTLVAAHSEKCLDVAGFSQTDGGAVHQWGCHGGANQQWVLNQVVPGTYTVKSVHSGKCLDVAGGSLADGGTVYQWTCHGGTNQQWRLSGPPTVGQVVTLTAVHSGRCLDVQGLSVENGATVYQWGCHGGANQQWRVGNTAPPPPVALAQVSAATGSDGRTYTFSRREDGRVLAREQQAGGGWSDWYPLATASTGLSPTAAVNSQGRVEVYVVGTDNAIYRNVSTGAGPTGWSGWSGIAPCCIVSEVSVVRDRFGRMNVLGRGTDHGIYVNRETTPGSNAWAGWSGLGPYLTTPPAAVLDTNGRVVVFAVGGDQQVYFNRLIDIGADHRQASGWIGIGGGPVVGELTVAGPGATVFVRRGDNLVYASHMQGDGWRPWVSVGPGALVSDPVAVGGTGGTPMVVALGTDNQVYASQLTCWGGDWSCPEARYSGWHLTGSGQFAVAPATTRLPDGRYQIIGLAPDRRMYVNTQIGGVSFGGWTPL
jgi:hypothetical protein